jgi:hypothetical protein
MNWMSKLWGRFSDAAEEKSIRRGSVRFRPVGEMMESRALQSQVSPVVPDTGTDVAPPDTPPDPYSLPVATGDASDPGAAGSGAASTSLPVADDDSGMVDIKDQIEIDIDDIVVTTPTTPPGTIGS